MKLQLPVMSYAEARRQGYAAITHPVRLDTEAAMLQRMDRDMAGAQAVWVETTTDNGAQALELYRKRTEMRGEQGVVEA